MTPSHVNPASSPRLRVFGTPALVAGGGDETVLLAAGKPLLLLAHLVARHPTPVSREALSLLAWGERDDAHSRASLRQALYRLRQLLGHDAFEADDDVVRLTTTIDSDWGDATAAVTANDDLRLLAVVRGPYLQGLADGMGDEPDGWLHRERTRWRFCTAEAALRQGRTALGGGDIERAVTHAERAVADRPDGIAGWELLLDALHATENPARLSDGLARLEAAGTSGALESGSTAAWRALLRRVGRRADATAARPPVVTEADPLPFVGREAVLARLVEVSGLGAGETSRGIAIVAGPGFGKSRLLREWARRLTASRTKVVQVEALVAEHTTPWSLLGRVVEALADFPEALGMDHAAAAVLVALNPRLGERFAGVMRGGGHSVDEGALARALEELLAAVAEHQAVHLLIDDVQWGDASSMRVIHRVLGNSGGTVVAVLASRDDAVMPPPPWLVVQLPSLGVDDLIVAVAHAFPARTAHEHAAAADALLLATGGVPIYLVRAMHRLRADASVGDLATRIGAMALHRAPNFPADALDRLLLGYLAIAGSAVSDTELLAGVDGAAGGALQPALSRLGREGWVTITSRGAQLSHGLIQRQVLETLTTAEGRRLALRRAEWLATHGDALHDLQGAVRLCVRHDALPQAARAVRRWRRRLPAGVQGRRLVELLLPAEAPRRWRWRLAAAATPALLGWIGGFVVVALLGAWGVTAWLRQPASLQLENVPRMQNIDPHGKVARNAVAPVLTVRDHLGRITTLLDGRPLDVVGHSPNVDSVPTTGPMLVRDGMVIAEQLRPYFSPQDSAQLVFRVASLPPLAVTVFRGFDIQSLQVVGGVLNGQVLSGPAPEVTVSPGDSLFGTVTLRYTTPTQAATWMLGESSTMGLSLPDTSTVITLHAGAVGALTDVLVQRRVPTTPGRYWLVYAFAAEGEAGQIFSMTNRACPTQHWGDGNDLLDGADTALSRIGGGGFLVRQRDHCDGGKPSRALTGYSVAAIRVIVR